MNIPTGSVGNAIVRRGIIDNCVIDMTGNRITTVGDPINPQDTANKRYVDGLVGGGSLGGSHLNGMSGGSLPPPPPAGVVTTTVTLTGTTAIVVNAALLGYFFITVTNVVTNGPCAVFSVSKNNATATANINTLNGVPGVGDTTFLSLTWAASAGLTLSKSNASFDGQYKVACSAFLTTNTSATNIVLVSTTPVTFLSALVGVFQFQIYSNFANGPIGTFSVSKNNQTAAASCYKLSGVPGLSTLEALRVEWPDGVGPQVYKTGAGYDGIYTVQFR